MCLKSEIAEVGSEHPDGNPNEFLLQELQLMEGEIQRLRAEGVSRLNFLFSITSALFGALLAIAGLGKLSSQQIVVGFIVASFMLFIVSLSTYEFAVSRDILCDKNARGTGRIRRYFLTKHPEIEAHLSWQTNDEPTHWVQSNKSDIRRVAIFFSSTLAGLACGASVFRVLASLEFAVATFMGVSVLIGLALTLWAKQRLRTVYQRAQAECKFSK
jgi:hypothetical protein